jgi:hypothetical protein
MVKSIAIILGALWIFGLVTSSIPDGFIHILLVLAIVFVMWSLIKDRRKFELACLKKRKPVSL